MRRVLGWLGWAFLIYVALSIAVTAIWMAWNILSGPRALGAICILGAIAFFWAMENLEVRRRR